MEEKNSNLNMENNNNSEYINIEDNNLKDNEVEEEENDNYLNEINDKISFTYDMKNISKNKNDKIITLDTLVYEIIGPESKYKNYDKISAEIKNAEQISKIEKAKLEKKINLMNQRLNESKVSNKNEAKENEIEDPENNNDKNVQNKLLNIQMKKLIMLEYERDKKYNFIEVIQKLKIPPEKRKIRDILRIKTYMDQSKLGLNFKEEFPDMNTAEKLIHFCCIEMRYKKFKKDEIIIKIGEPPELFYSIIFGKVKIVKPMPKVESFTGFQYFKYLMEMRKKNEMYIFNQCIKINKNDFFIESNDSEKIRYLYLYNYLEHIKTINDPKIDLETILNLIDIKPEDLGINPSLVNNNYYITNNLNNIIKKMPVITPDIMEQYSFIFDNITKKAVNIFEYKTFSTLKTNDYFGDSSIETNSPRNATVIAEEDTDIAYLSNKLYYAQIASEKAILLQIKIKNLHQNFFFHRIQYYKFSKKYFNWFISEKFNKGDKVFNEDEEIKYLYFIREGSVQLYFSKSMNEIDSLINIINNKRDIFTRNNYINIHLNILKSKENNNKPKENNIYEYNQINSTFKDMEEYLDQKQNNKIIILNSNEEIGVVSYFLGNKYLTSCEIVSKTAKIYKLSIDYLDLMLEGEVEIKWDFYNRLKNKLKLYSERLFRINNLKLIMTDDKIIQKKIEKKKNEEKEKEEEEEKEKEKEKEKEEIIMPTNNSINKSLINFDKLNSFMNDKNDKINISHNYSIYHLHNNSNIKKSKNKNDINLPILNNNRYKQTYDFFDFLYKKKSVGGNAQMNQNLKFNNLKIFNILNQKQKILLSKRTIIEDNMLSKIKKDFISFSQNKFTLTKNSIKIDISRNDSFNKKDINESSIKNNSQVYLTEINNNNDSKHLINEKNSHYSPHIIEKNFDISDSISLESHKNFKNKLNYNYRSFSIDNNRYTNTENNNIIILNNKRNEFISGNKIRLHKNYKYNHPYYDPLTLIKKEQYRIFDNKNIRNSSKKDYLTLHLDKIRKLKNIRDIMKNKIKIKYKVNNVSNSKDQ